MTILLDCGHGRNTPGKKSPDKSLEEWAYNREIGQRLTKLLQEHGISVYNVHPEENEVWPGGRRNLTYDLRLRTDRANKKYDELRAKGETAIYLSIHVNSASGSGWHNARGFVPYVYREASQTSRKFATILYEEALKRGLKGNRSMGGSTYKEAGFWVIRKTKMPAVLTENLFMDNHEDVDFLLSEKGKETIADLHLQAILRLAGKK